MNRWAVIYIKTENVLTNALMIGVVFFVFIAAVMRWAGFPLSWSVEFAQFLFAWVIFLGANRALREDRHIGVDFVTKRLPVAWRLRIELIVIVLMIGFLLFIGVYGVMLSIENAVRQISNLPISYSFITLSVPVGCLMMCVTLLLRFKRKLVHYQSQPDLTASRKG